MSKILKGTVAFFAAVLISFSCAAQDIIGQLLPAQSSAEFYAQRIYNGTDRTALCFARLNGSVGADAYAASIEKHAQQLLNGVGFIKPTDLQYAAIILSAVGGDTSELIGQAVYYNESFNKQGFNAYVWGLIALNCCDIPQPNDAINTKESIAQYLLSKQLEDGGFSLKGSVADCDITSAVIYALAPLSNAPEIADALECAEQCITAMQLESGGFMSLGVENCESTAQAVIALTALGASSDDPRVAKALSAIMNYRTEDGFSHLVSGSTNGLSTAQALEAFTAAELAKQGRQLYNAARQRISQSSEEASLPDNEALTEIADAASTEATASNSLNGGQIKLVIVSVLLAAASICVAFFFITHRKNKALLTAGLILAAAAAGAALLDIRTPEEYYAQKPVSGGITVSVSAECSAAAENLDLIDTAVNPPEVIPADGIVLEKTEVAIPEGASAFDALIAAARQQQVRVDYVGSGYGVYVSGIGYIYEFGFGDTSGWKYKVNGEYPSVSAGNLALSEGDNVEFMYTLTL